MKTAVIGAVLLVGIAGALGGRRLGLSFPQAQEAGKTEGAPEEVVVKRFGRASLRDFQPTVPWVGRVVNPDLVRVVAMETGRIASVEATDEAAVKEGALLFTLGGPQAAGRLEVLKAKVASLGHRLALAERMVSRKERSVAQKTALLDELEAAEGAAAELRTALAEALADLRLLEDRLQVRAPRGGIFTHRAASVGQEVQAGIALADIVDPARMRIVATAYPAEEADLEGRTAVLGGGEEAPKGVIRAVLPDLSPAGGTQVWIEGEDLFRARKMGETASGAILLDPVKAALCVPQTAIAYDQDETAYVFAKKQGQGWLDQRTVKTGLISDDGYVQILEGLTDEDEIVLVGAYEYFYRKLREQYVPPD